VSNSRQERPDARPRRGRGGSGAPAASPDWLAVDEQAFKSALRQVASAVFVLTAQAGETANGLTTTSLCSVSTEPPLVVVSINRGAAAERLVADSGAFAINYLTEDQHRIARLFTGTEFAPDERFAEGKWTRLATGAPVLEGALATFDCKVESQLEQGTHSIFFGRVVATLSLDQECLMWRDGSFRRLAPVV
jgi:flavin reductase